MKYKKQSHFENNPVLTKKNPHINSKKNAMKSEESPKEKTILSKKQKRQRQENSLDELTRAFIDYVKDTKKTEININDVVKKLKVKKRRIYDITNVLEGISQHLTFLFLYTHLFRYWLHQKASEKPSNVAENGNLFRPNKPYCPPPWAFHFQGAKNRKIKKT